jgi:hypothetical protein
MTGACTGNRRQRHSTATKESTSRLIAAFVAAAGQCSRSRLGEIRQNRQEARILHRIAYMVEMTRPCGKLLWCGPCGAYCYIRYQSTLVPDSPLHVLYTGYCIAHPRVEYCTSTVVVIWLYSVYILVRIESTRPWTCPLPVLSCSFPLPCT